MKDNIFWTYSNDVVNASFKDFIRENYPTFKFQYNWKNFPLVQDYLIRLMFNSYANSTSIRHQLPKLIHDVECFFASGICSGIFNGNNIPSIIDNLKNSESGFRIIEYLPPEFSGVFGNSINNKIQINSNMRMYSNRAILEDYEVRRLYMFHEMGHKILNILSNEKVIEDYIDTIEAVLKSKGFNVDDLKHKELVLDGFWMIEECLTQELAEYLAYYSAKKKRPSFHNTTDIGCNIQTNYDYYGIFQMPTINLGRTIRGCSKSNSTNEDILLRMIRKALNSNFDLELISEYNQGDARLYYDLFLTLKSMGIIKRQKYGSFGIGRYVPNLNIQECLDVIKKLADKNQDMRDYPVGGYPVINFDAYKVSPTRRHI